MIHFKTYGLEIANAAYFLYSIYMKHEIYWLQWASLLRIHAVHDITVIQCLNLVFISIHDRYVAVFVKWWAINPDNVVIYGCHRN